jgi:outer membrane protein OmpA-like peptidoglycan-associated protein
MKTVFRFSILVTLTILWGCQSSNKNFLGIDTPSDNKGSSTSTGFAQPAAVEETTDDKSQAIKLKKSFENGEYESAISELKEDLEDDPDSPATNYYLAESYRRSNRIYEASPYYAKAIAGGFSDDEMELHYAKALKANENYDEAKKVLNEYLQYATVEKFVDRAKNELDNLDKLDDIQLNVRKITVNPAAGINTPNAEYSPYYFDGHLYFSSTREPGDIFKGNGTSFSDLYKVKTSGLLTESGTLESLEDLINSEGVNEGTIAFSPDGNTMVFAKGNSGKKGGREDVDLFITEKRNGQWTQPSLMPINSPDYWDSSPVFNQSGNVLYFASNRPGGVGGHDIYRASKNDRGRWANVENLGSAINTPENEMFPYVSPDNKLFFASDGHAGFGMLDLFEAVNEGGNVTVRNMGPSINSAYDDFGLVFSDFPFEGFFSSNRPGGQGDDDIYTFVDDTPDLKQIEYVVKGKTFSVDQDSARTILGGVRVKLLDENDQLIDDVITGRGGVFEFKVEAEKVYKLTGEKADYFTDRTTLSTIGETIPKEELIDRFNTKTFERELDLGIVVTDIPIVVQNVYYDVDKSDIRPDAALELDKLVQFLKDNPAITIELSSHTDSRAPDDYNQRLSQDRADAAVNYIVSKGIARNRLTAKGYGETQLVNGCDNDNQDSCTEEQHQANRRTEFKVIEYDKSKVGN